MTHARRFLAVPLLLAAALFLPIVTAATPAAAPAEMAPERVARLVYAEIQDIHGNRATPRMYFGVRAGRTRSSCGRIDGSAYCPADHALFITTRDIRMAYRYGDAALAFIIAHEYAHAMQAAFRFMPGYRARVELQADCLAGVYLGTMPNVSMDRSDVNEIGSLAHRIGDYGWGRQHHGTPAQRVRAVLRGISASRQGFQGAKACFAA
jgi:uncharacterized protein